MYELNQVGAHTYYIDSPANVGVYEYGGKCCFIDGGSDRSAAKKALDRITEKGWKLEKIICTHSHADHTGGCAFLKDRAGCEVFAPGVCAQVLRYPYIMPTTLYGGCPMEEMRSKFIMAKACECKELSESDLPEGLSFTHLDGHDFEQIAVKTCDDVWFIADAVADESTLEKYKCAFLYDIGEHLLSLEKLKTLEGALFIPAHSAPRNEIVSLAEFNIKNVHEVAENIKNLCENGITIDELIEKMFSGYGIKLYLMQYELIGATARSYLSWLSKNKEIECVYEGSRLLWKTVRNEEK